MCYSIHQWLWFRGCGCVEGHRAEAGSTAVWLVICPAISRGLIKCGFTKAWISPLEGGDYCTPLSAYINKCQSRLAVQFHLHWTESSLVHQNLIRHLPPPNGANFEFSLVSIDLHKVWNFRNFAPIISCFIDFGIPSSTLLMRKSKHSTLLQHSFIRVNSTRKFLCLSLRVIRFNYHTPNEFETSAQTSRNGEN